MSSASNRYVGWFGTRVPVASRGLLFVITAGIAFALSFTLLQIWLGSNILIYSIFIPAIGLAVHLMLASLQLVWLRTDASDSRLNELIAEMDQKVITSERTLVWIRKSPTPYIVSSYTLLFDAVIISEPMVDLILQSPESGRALLAFHFFRMPRSRWIWDLVGGILIFYIVSFSMDAYVIPMFFTVSPFMYLSLLIVLGPMGFLIPFVLMIFTKSVFWRHETAFEETLEVFGLHPQVAKVQVERGYELDDDEHHAVLWGVLEWERGKRGGRRASSAVVALAIVWLLPMLSVFQHPEIMYYQPLLVNIYIPAIAILSAVIIYILLRVWDKKAMASVLYATEGAREPIWMD